MKVVPPIEITPEKIVSNNVPETDYPAWVVTTAYPTIGTRLTWKHRNYESLAAAPAGVEPGNETVTSASPAKWLDLGPTNCWRMFNKRTGNVWSVGTFTSNPGSIDLTIRPAARINSIGLVGVRAATVHITMIVGGATVYDKTFTMSSKAGGSWYRYYFGAFVTKDNVAQFDLPAFSNADIRVVASAPGGTAQIGMMVIGMSRDIGWARWSTGIGFDNYSNVKDDDFGNTTITTRGSRDYVDFDVAMYTPQVSTAKRVLNDLKDTAALYIGSEIVDPTIIVGRFDRFQLVLSNVAISEYSLEVRSLM